MLKRFCKKTYRKRATERPGSRRESNMGMDLRKIVLELVEWIYLAQKWDP
jgi:hypothetical protein